MLLALSCVAATAVGLLFLIHPMAVWPYGTAHRSDAPPMFGVGLLVVPVVVVGLGLRFGWDALTLDIEAWREHRARRR